MDTLNNIVNTCELTRGNSGTIAYYSHLIPVILSLILAIFVLVKSKYNLFSKIFILFITTFSIWLVGDVILWTQNNYFLQYASWSPLLYIEILFYTLGLYFVMVFVKKSDVSILVKIILFLATLPPFIITIMNHAVTGFNYPVCEAFNNNFLDNYKLVYESIILLIILFYALVPIIKKLSKEEKRASLIMLGSMFLFLAFFGVTEYIGAYTGVYEINLYSLFLLPIFLIVIIYAVFELDIFNFHILGTHYLVIGLVILMGGQLFFMNGATDRILTIATVIATLGISFVLFKNLKRESDQRVHIEKLSVELEKSKMRLEETNIKLADANDQLKSLDKLKTEFLSLASHQLRSPLTAIIGYSSMLLDGDFGKITEEKQREALDRVFTSSRHLAVVIEDFLNVAKIEQGGMKYEMSPFDFGKAAQDLENDMKMPAEKKGLEFSFENDGKAPYMVNGDMEKLRQVILNITDNSIKYTEKGSIKVMLTKDEKKKKIRLAITDTGMGMTPEIKATLFQKFARGEGGKVNTGGSGLGLYLAKEIIKAHNGLIDVTSPGPGLGSTFFMELDTI